MIAGWTAGSWGPIPQVSVPSRSVPVDLKKRYSGMVEIIYSANFKKPAVPTFRQDETE